MTTGEPAPQVTHDGANQVDGLAGSDGVTIAVNCGTATVQHLHFRGAYSRLRDAAIALGPLPGFLRLGNPQDRDDVVGMFTGRKWPVDRIDAVIGECVRRNVGAYLLVEAEAGMGKTALGAVWPIMS